MKDENSVPAAQKMTDVSLSIFRSKFKKTRIQMIDYIPGNDNNALLFSVTHDRREQRLNRILLKDCNLVGIASFQVSLHYLFYFIYGCGFPLHDNPRAPIIPLAAAPVSDTAFTKT